MSLPEINLGEIAGYVASGLLLATFSVRTMIPLRILGISSSVAFLTYGFLSGLLPIIVLHVILLPLNLYRFYEMHRLTREMRDAAEGAQGFAAFLPFMSSVSQPAGTTLFRKDDAADDMYVLTAGRIRLPDFDVEVGPGELVGEIGMFAPAGRRMTTAVCAEDCRLQRITRERVREMVFQNPRIGFYLIGVVTGRLLEDLRKLERSAPEAPGATA
jgi:CRP/FNR family transcriptional regulator, cyclic AMP receptor protein